MAARYLLLTEKSDFGILSVLSLGAAAPGDGVAGSGILGGTPNS